MAQMLYGKPVADALTADTRRRADLLRDKGVMPKLVILRCGENEADGAYIRGAMKRAVYAAWTWSCGRWRRMCPPIHWPGR